MIIYIISWDFVNFFKKFPFLQLWLQVVKSEICWKTQRFDFYKKKIRRLVFANNIFNSEHRIPDLPLNQWTKVRISQMMLNDRTFRYSIKVGSETLEAIINTSPKEYSSLKVFSADAFCPAALARIDNIKVATYGKS